MKNIVYLINGDDNRYKIGVTTEKRLSNRIKQLQTGSSCKLQLITTYKSNYASLIEKTLHRELAPAHLVGEWFVLNTDQVFTFIERCNKIETNINLLKDQNNDYILKLLKNRT